MRIHRLILLLMCALLIIACNVPFLAASKRPTPTVNLPTSTFTPALPPTLTVTPAPTLSPTPSAPQLTLNSPVVNCRTGPDVAYRSLDTINSGQTAVIAGRDDNSTWWYVRDPNNTSQFCWVSASITTTSGNLNNLPVIPSLAVIATNVTCERVGQLQHVRRTQSS